MLWHLLDWVRHLDVLMCCSHLPGPCCSNRFFETFSYLPPLSDNEISKQVQYSIFSSCFLLLAQAHTCLQTALLRRVCVHRRRRLATFSHFQRIVALA